MNSESPLRVSSTAVTAACIVCGIFVASLLVKKLAPTAPSFLHFGGDTKATAANQSLQEKLAEFQRDAHRGGSQHAAVTLPETGRESKTHSSIAEILGSRRRFMIFWLLPKVVKVILPWSMTYHMADRKSVV